MQEEIKGNKQPQSGGVGIQEEMLTLNRTRTVFLVHGHKNMGEGHIFASKKQMHTELNISARNRPRSWAIMKDKGDSRGRHNAELSWNKEQTKEMTCPGGCSHKEEMVLHDSEANKEDKFFGGVQNNKQYNIGLRGREKYSEQEEKLVVYNYKSR